MKTTTKKELTPNDSIEIILNAIQEKFGSLRRFNLMAGRPEFDLYYWKKKPFKNQGRFKDLKARVIEDFEKLKNEHLYLTNNDLDMIQTAIWNTSRTVTAFCDKYPEFANSWISRLLSGEFRKVTKKIKRLLYILELER